MDMSHKDLLPAQTVSSVAKISYSTDTLTRIPGVIDALRICVGHLVQVVDLLDTYFYVDKQDQEQVLL